MAWGGTARRAAGPALSRVLLLLALMVVLPWQGTLIQSHFHPQPAFSSAPTHLAGHRPADNRQAPLPPDECPICQEAALADAYVPSTPVPLPIPEAGTSWYTTDRTVHAVSRQQAHHWRSRAPPVTSSLSI